MRRKVNTKSGTFKFKSCIRESSFNMTRGRDEDIEGGL